MAAALTSPLINRALADLFRLECRLGRSFAALAESAAGHHEARALLDGFARLAAVHLAAVTVRLEQLGEVPRPADVHRLSLDVRSPSTALRAAYALLADASIAYAMLQPITSRFRDSAISAPEGLTGHLARTHTQDYVAAQGKVAQLIHDVVLWEMAEAGLECQCTCPACGLGACVCGIGARAVLSEAWLAARPTAEPANWGLPRPRRTSAAAVTGLREGDILASVDDIPLESYPQLQTAIKAHEIGTRFPVSVIRRGSASRLLVQRFVDIGDAALPLDCEAPSGEVFYLDRAKDLQRRMRRRASAGSGAPVLARLSARETQILRLVANGATNPMIAEKLRISRPTVARHIANILVKLEVTNRTEAAAIAASAGLANDSP